ncbi:MAG: ABC transporter ATP-binding protein, partial [candidate division NC10 bacterium]|nr:ABC transporter ATP-binding protein [candidate division NC10 bacterium]
MVEVRVENVRKTYGRVEALRGVSLNFRSWALTAILGPSGCGKTTLLRSIAGFIAVDAGRILFDTEEVGGLPPQRRGTAMVFQNYALWPHMTIFENVGYGLRLQKVPADEVRRRVRKVLELVEIGNLADVESRRPSALSGGQQQRVALARALVVEPNVLAMDEPLSNLDAKVRQRLRVELRRLQKQVGITAIYVTHDQEEALALADTVVLMDQGMIVQTGTPQEIYLKPTTAFAAEFLGVSNQLEGEVTDG